MVGINQRTVGHAHLHSSGLELAQVQGLQVELHRQNAPGVYQRQVGQAFVGPGLPARLLLELLRGQQGTRSP